MKMRLNEDAHEYCITRIRNSTWSIEGRPTRSEDGDKGDDSSMKMRWRMGMRLRLREYFSDI